MLLQRKRLKYVLNCNTSEGSLHCNICCSPLSLCPSWLLQHTAVITRNSTWGSSETSCLMTHWVFVLPRWLSGSILFSAFLHWFRSGLHGQQVQEVNPDHPLRSYLLQLLLRITMVFQGWMGAIIPPACAGSASGAPFSCTCSQQSASWCHLVSHFKCPLLMWRSSSSALRASWMIELLCVCAYCTC